MKAINEAGLPQRPAQHMDGVNLLPLIEGGTIDRDTLYWHFPYYQGEGSYPASAIRQGKLKLIYHHHHGTSKLFDLVADPHERRSIMQKEATAGAELHRQLFEYLEEVDAVIPVEKK